MNHKQKLDELFQQAQEDGCPPKNKMSFIGDYIFDFTTYDDDISELMAQAMIEVLLVILNNKTFEYLDKTASEHINYFMMVNMPFLQGKLNWGGSIRGAWLDEYGNTSEKDPQYKITHEWSIPKKEIKSFINDLIEWSKE